VVAQPDERHANRAASVLEWYDRIQGIVQHLAQTKTRAINRLRFSLLFNWCGCAALRLSVNSKLREITRFHICSFNVFSYWNSKQDKKVLSWKANMLH